MISQRKRFSILLTITLLSMVAVTQTACDSRLREARKAAHRIQVVTDGLIDTTTVLYHDNVINTDKKNQVALILLRINTGNKVLIDKAEAATADTPEVRASLLTQLRLIEDGIKALKAAGVIGLRSTNGQLAFDSGISALDGAIAIIQTKLSGGGK